MQTSKTSQIMNIKINPSVYKAGLSDEECADILIEALQYMENKYPKVNFDNFDLIFKGSPKQRGSNYTRRGTYEQGKKVIKKRIINLSIRPMICLYKKSDIGTYNVYQSVSHHIGGVSALIHEMTHHMQYEINGDVNEIETTFNELEYLENYHPDVYAKMNHTKKLGIYCGNIYSLKSKRVANKS